MKVPKPNVTSKPAYIGNYKRGRSAKISQITFHHIVGDAGAAIARFKTPGQEVSATYVIGSDGRIYQCVAEGDTPYTDANWDSNSRSITIEHAGGHPNVPYTKEMYAASKKLVAYLIDKYGIKSFKRHRDVSRTPTACPGTLKVEDIVKGAKDIVAQTHKPSPAPKPVGNYKVLTSVKGYVTALDAKARKNAKNTVKPGSYFIYNQSNGMVNVTKDKNVPGSWINPGDNKKPAPKPVKKSNATIAREVVAGKWGNGPERVSRLKKAGYNPKTIQALVNKLV